MPDSSSSSNVGVEAYRAPEIILSSNYDCKVDVWSIGCLAYFIFTKKELFIAKNNSEILAEIIKLIGVPSSDQLADIGSNYLDLKLPKLSTLDLKIKLRNVGIEESVV